MSHALIGLGRTAIAATSLVVATQTGNVAPDTFSEIISRCGSSETCLLGASANEPIGGTRLSAIWRFGSTAPKVIRACWENDGLDDRQAQQWVKEQITQKAWSKVSALKFVGWDRCPDNLRPADYVVRIYITKGAMRPATKALGMDLNGLRSGVVLNFGSIADLAAHCPSRIGSHPFWDRRQLCIRALATHEFGHVIGLVHEQNLDDAPECIYGKSGSKPDTPLTQYDFESVMNYCSKTPLNGGNLSPQDIKAAQLLYCSFDEPMCESLSTRLSSAAE